MTKALWISWLFIFLLPILLVSDEIDGFWMKLNESGKPGIIVSIYEHANKHYGRIIGSYDDEGALDDSIYAASSKAKGVKGNPFYSGLDFIWNLVKKGNRYKGKIMDPRKGKTYDVELWVQDGQLVVRGMILCFGRSEFWKPASESDFSPSFEKPDTGAFVPIIPEAAE